MKPLNFQKESFDPTGFTQIAENLFISDTELAGQMQLGIGTSCDFTKVALSDVTKINIKRRVHKYNLHIKTDVAHFRLTGSQSEMEKIGNIVSEKIISNGNSVFRMQKTTITPNIREVIPMCSTGEAEGCFGSFGCLGCLGIIIYPFFALAYYIFTPLINIILRLVIK